MAKRTFFFLPMNLPLALSVANDRVLPHLHLNGLICTGHRASADENYCKICHSCFAQSEHPWCSGTATSDMTSVNSSHINIQTVTVASSAPASQLRGRFCEYKRPGSWEVNRHSKPDNQESLSKNTFSSLLPELSVLQGSEGSQHHKGLSM